MQKKYLKHDAAMKELADKVKLTFDGSNSDSKETRLFANRCEAETLHLSEKEYSEMERILDKFSIKGKGFKVYAWNDSSGFDYWTTRQEEDNYIQITVNVENPTKVDIEELKSAIEDAEIEFSNYRSEYYFY